LDSTKVIDMRLIRVDAAINSGNSGGGLYDMYGNLIGIVNSKMASSNIDNVGYAIPINVASAIADQVIYQCDGLYKTSLNSRVKVLKTENLGFDATNGISKSKVIINSNNQKEWLVTYNILVSDIKQNSLAYQAGIRDDDIITDIVFESMNHSSEMYFNQDFELDDLLLKVKPNTSSISFKVLRGRDEYTCTITLTSDCFTEIC
jgi:serine protease Do